MADRSTKSNKEKSKPKHTQKSASENQPHIDSKDAGFPNIDFKKLIGCGG
ncbi:hypothetical protein [Reichenbachiella versicolor]|nr:hypothetical protein [Reichenbachiella versicolor]